MDDALGCKLLHHAPGGEFVVVRAREPLGDSLEGHQKAGEIGEMVESFGFGQGEGAGVVARAELDERGGQDGAFEMEMQLGLGEAADEGLDVGHGFSLAVLAAELMELRAIAAEV